MIFLELFYTFFKIGLFSFGGGYAMLALIQDEVVNKHAWITVGKFTDIIAISQVTPGPIAINTATYIGYESTQSVWGSFVATLGVSAPSVIVTTLLFLFLQKYSSHPIVQNAFKGLRVAVVGLLLSASVMLMNSENFIDKNSFIIFAVSCLLIFFKNISAIYLMLLSAGAGILLYG